MNFILSYKKDGHRWFVDSDGRGMPDSSVAQVFPSKFAAKRCAEKLGITDIELYPADNYYYPPTPTIKDSPKKTVRKIKRNIPMQTQEPKKNVFDTLQEQLTLALERINTCSPDDIEKEIKRAHGIAEIANALIQGANAQANCVKVAEGLQHSVMPVNLLEHKNG